MWNILEIEIFLKTDTIKMWQNAEMKEELIRRFRIFSILTFEDNT